MVYADDVHFAHPRPAHEREHRVHVAREQDAGALVRGEFRQRTGHRIHGVEVHLHLRRGPHAIQLLLPLAARDFVVHEHDEADVEWLPPPDHDLAMNQAIVDPVEDQGHVFPPCAVIAARPRSTAWRAASIAGTSSANTKSSSMGRFAPATSRTSGRSRRIRRAAIVQLPSWRSVNTTVTPVSSTVCTSSLSRSAPLRSRAEIARNALPRPVIWSTADTSPAANSPCPATIARTARTPEETRLLIVFLKVAPHFGGRAHLL